MICHSVVVPILLVEDIVSPLARAEQAMSRPLIRKVNGDQ